MGRAERGGDQHVVVVVGAGISGLAGAWRLSRSAPGLRVVVLEQADRYGGVLLAEALDPQGTIRADVGAEAVLARRPEAVALAREVGLDDDLVTPATTRAGVYSRGRLHPMPAGTVMGVPSDPEALGGLLSDDEVARLAAEPGLAPVPLRGDVDVGGFVASRVGQAVVDRLVEPLLGGVYAGHADRLSLKATIPALWPAAEKGTSLLETVRSQVAVGTAAGSAGRPAVFAGIRGGVARLATVLVEELSSSGVEVRTRACVQRLRRAGARWRVELGPAGRGEVLEADAVLVALPARRASRLLREVAPAAADELAAVRTASVAIASYVVPGPVLDGLDLSGFLVPPVEGRLVKAVTFSSRKWEWLGDDAGERAVVRASVGRADEEAVLQVPDRRLLQAAAADVAEMLDRPVPVLASRLTRWGGALPQYDVGHVERVQRIREAVREQAGLAVAGASYDGLGIAACVATADAAAEELLAHVC